jgi:hypothetical protein
MRINLLVAAVFIFSLVVESAQAQTTTKKTTTTTKKTANGYHRTSNVRAKPRAGAYSRYDRSGRRNEENLKLAPGVRLNMPSPPTTDYMGRPLKKKTVAKTTSTSSTISSEPVPAKKAPATTPKKK